MSFGGAAANLGSAFGQILISTGNSQTQISALGDSLDTLDKHTALSGGSAQIAGAAFAGLGAAIGAGFGLALNDAANFEQRMSAVQAVTGATGTAFADLNAKALQLGKDTQYSATEAASAIEELAKAGVSVTDILNGAASAAVSLAAAGGLGLPEAATIIANTMNEFAIDGKNVSSVADIFAAAASATAADVTGLGNALNYVGATAHALGETLPDVVALLAALADQGLKDTAAGTALNQMILSIASPTSAAQDELNALGISVFDAAGNFTGAAKFVQDFATATKGMTEQQRLAAENIIFTTHGMNALNLLLNDTTDSAAKAGKSLPDYTAAVEKQGAAAQQAAARMDNFKGSLEQLRGSVETIMIEVGDTFLQGARKLVDGATLIVNALIGLPKPVLEGATAIIGLAGALSALIGAYILLEPKIHAFTDALVTIKPILLDVSGPVLLIAAAVALLGAAFHDNFGGIKSDVDGWASDLIGKLDTAKAAVETFFGIFSGLLEHGRTDIGLLGSFAKAFDAFQSLGFGAVSATELGDALIKMRVPMVELMNDFNAVSRVAAGFFDVLNGGASDANAAKFIKYVDILFGPDVGNQFIDATAKLRVALQGLGASIKDATGIDVSKWINFKNVLLDLMAAAVDVSHFINFELLPAIGTILITAIDGTIIVLDFLTNHMNGISGAVLSLAADFGTVLGGALKFTADLLSGDFSGALDQLGKTIAGIFNTGVDLATISIHIGEFLFDTASKGLQDLIQWAYGELGISTGKGGKASTAPIPIDTAVVTIGDWLITEGEKAIGTLLGRLKEKVYAELGIGPGGGRGGLGAGAGAAGGVDIGTMNVSITDWLVSLGEKAIGTLAGKIKAAVFGALGIGGSKPADEAQAFGASFAGTPTVPIGPQGVQITGWQVSDITKGLSSLAGQVLAAVNSAWDAIKGIVHPLADAAVSLGFKVADAAETLGVDVAIAIDGAWPTIRDDAKALADKAVSLGFKIADIAANLASDVAIAIDGAWPGIRDEAKALADKALSLGFKVADAAEALGTAVIGAIADAWPTIRDAATNVYGKAVDIGGVVVNEVTSGDLWDQTTNFVTKTLAGFGVTVDGWSLHIAAPGGSSGSLADVPGHQGGSGGITVDGPGIVKAANNAVNDSIDSTANAQTYAASRNAGYKAGQSFGFIAADAVVAGAVAAAVTTWEAMKVAKAAAGLGANFALAFVGGIAADLLHGAINLDDKFAVFTGKLGGKLRDYMDGLGGKLLAYLGPSNPDSLISSLINGGVAGGILVGFIVGKVIGLFGDGAKVGEAVVSGLAGFASGLLASVLTWWSGVLSSIEGLFGGGGSSNASAASSGGLVGAALANGAGSSNTGSIVYDALKGIFDVDLSGIDLPKLPNWVFDPLNLIPGIGALLKGLGDAANLVQSAWDKIFGINDSEGGHKPPALQEFQNPGQATRTTAPAGPGGVLVTPAPTAGAEVTAAPTKVTTPTSVTAKPDPTGTPTTDGTSKIIADFLRGAGLSGVTFDTGKGGSGTSGPLAVKVPVSYQTTTGAAPTPTTAQGSKGGAGAIGGVLTGLGLLNVATGSGGLTADTPPVTVTVPVSFGEKASSQAAAGFTATFKGDDTDVLKKYDEALTWGDIWASKTFTGFFDGDNSGAGKQYDGAVSYGDAWNGTTWTGFYDGDNSGAGDQYDGAVSYGDAWNGRVFTAYFDIDTSGITAAVNIVDAAVAHIAAVLPHSPAREGPLSQPISFAYIADNMKATAGRLKSYASDSAATVAGAFGNTPNLLAQLGSQSVAPAGQSGGVTVIQYSLHADEYQTLLENAQRGAAADNWIRDYSG